MKTDQAAPSAARPLRMAIIANSAFALANFRGPLIRQLVGGGVEVAALAPDLDETSRRTISALGATPVPIMLDRTGLHPRRDVASLVQLTRTLQRLRPDITLAAMAKPVIYGGFAAFLSGVPRHYAMVEGLGSVFDESSSSWRRVLLRSFVKSLYRLAFRKARKVVFLNDDDLNELVASNLLPRRKAVKLGGIGLDLDHYRPAPVPDGPLRFLLVARLLRQKGITDFVAAARIVRRLHPEATFTILGATDTNPDTHGQDEMEAWVAEGTIRWPGQVADVRPWIAQSSVFVLPSYREGLPRSTQEAMAMARPVITTDAVGCRETVEEGVNGFLVPPRNPQALAAAMLRFIESPELIGPMGRESRRLAEERFDARVINRRLMTELGISPGE